MPTPTTPTHITQLWNTAYPTMRTIATTAIDHTRQQIRDEAWNIDPNHPHAAALRAHAPTEANLRRRLKNRTELRRTLHQLDQGTHRACTRSPGGFSIVAAYASVRSLLKVTSLNDHGLAAVYQLAAGLAAEADEQRRELSDRAA